MGSVDMNERAFWKRVHRPASSFGCWEWQGKKDRDGYGVYRVKKRDYRAYRMAYEFWFGVTPKVVRHLCDNRACCNPFHLRDGSQEQNIVDRDRKNRQAKGSSNGRSKLTEGEVYLIKRYLAAGEKSLTALGQRFGVSRYVIRDIKSRKTWGHVIIGTSPRLGSGWEICYFIAVDRRGQSHPPSRSGVFSPASLSSHSPTFRSRVDTTAWILHGGGNREEPMS